MDWDYVKKHYNDDPKCACALANHFIRNILLKSKALTTKQRDTLKGILPGGDAHKLIMPIAEWYYVAYWYDYFHQFYTIGYCKDLDYNDNFYRLLGNTPIVKLTDSMDIGTGWGRTLIELTFGKAKDFDKFIKTSFGQDIIKGLMTNVLHFMWSQAIADVALIVWIATMIGMITGFENWLESLGLPAWLLDPILAFLGTGKNNLQKQLTLTEADLQSIANLISADNPILKGIFNAAISGLNSTVNDIETAISNTVETDLNTITPVINNIQGYIKGKISNAITTIKTKIDNVINPLVDKVTNGDKAIENRLDKMVNGSLRLDLTEMFGG